LKNTAGSRKDRHAMLSPQLLELWVDEALDQSKELAQVRPWIWLTNRFSSAERVVND
jgi:hypothetical protein